MKLIFNYFGYEITFITLAIVALLIALIVFTVGNKKTVQKLYIAEDTPNMGQIIRLLFNPQLLAIGVCGGLMVGSLEGFADVWAMPFFTQVYGVSDIEASFASSVVFMGMCVGGPILAYLADSFNSSIRVIVLTGVMTCGLFIVLFYMTSLSYIVILGLMFALGILCCYQVLVFAVVSNMVDRNYASMAIAIVNCLNMSFGYLFHRVIGNTIGWNWDGALSALGDPLYSHQAYIISLSVIPISCFVGSLGFIYFESCKKMAVEKPC